MSLFTPQEAGKKLRIAPVTVLGLFDAGELAGVILRKGVRKRVIRFREKALEQFLTSREKKTDK